MSVDSSRNNWGPDGSPRRFISVQEEGFYHVLRTADRLLRGIELLVADYGLTFTQYNVLKILRRAGESGANGREIARGMITSEPDMTRLLDRMEKRSLLERVRDESDRRYMTARLTPRGRDVLHQLDEPVAALHSLQFAALPQGEMEQLIALLRHTGIEVSGAESPSTE